MRDEPTHRILADARAWAAADPDPETRAALERLIGDGVSDELISCMRPLEFGTAGLRALEGPGPGRMNLAVVIRTARGLSDYWHRSHPDASRRMVVIGYDARRNSRLYAETAIEVLLGARLNVRYFVEPVPTPLVAYAARKYGALAALCITASHNPRDYAGIKVYAANAVQIVPPADWEIAQAIEAVGPANRVVRVDLTEARGHGEPSAVAVESDLIDRYVSDLTAMRPTSFERPELGIVYTPLHGVGGAIMTQALSRAGYQRVFPVEEQYQPDPEFPTVPSPNPEEPGALDAATKLAGQVEADLVLAHDPDADRLAVAIPSDHGFRALSGNQLGVLLAHYVLEHGALGPQALVVSSIVSTPMITSIAAEYGARSVRTLTGFKWMLNAALALEREAGLRFVYGFEEALGYCIAGPVRDKDGISAGLWFADLVAEARSKGQSVDDVLLALFEKHGLWTSRLSTLSLEQTGEARERVERAIRRLVDEPPVSLAGIQIERVVDYMRGAEQRPWYLGRAELVELCLEAGARVLFRPSGTEPKLKIYVDWRQDLNASLPTDQQIRAAERSAEQLADGAVALICDGMGST